MSSSIEHDPFPTNGDVHGQLLVADMHAHPFIPMVYLHQDLSRLHRHGMPFGCKWDVPRARMGGVKVQVCTAYLPPWPLRQRDPVAATLGQFERLRQVVARNAATVALASGAADLRRIVAEGRLALLLSIEGGHALGGRLEALDAYARCGVAYITLTHFLPNAICDSRDLSRGSRRPLTDFGEQVVRRMNELGILIDVAHCTERTVGHLADTTSAPLLITHTGLTALARTRRNCSDAMVRDVARTGGVVGITAIGALLHAAGAHASLEAMIDHVVHAASQVGIEHVGIGTDFDAWPWSLRDFRDASDWPKLTEALLARDFSEAEVALVMGGNFLRVLDQVEAKRLRPAQDASIQASA